MQCFTRRPVRDAVEHEVVGLAGVELAGSIEDRHFSLLALAGVVNLSGAVGFQDHATSVLPLGQVPHGAVRAGQLRLGWVGLD